MHMGMHLGRVRQMPDQRARRGTFRRMLLVFTPYWRRSAVVLAAILINAALGQVNPVVMGLIIDRAFAHRDLNLLGILVLIMFLTPVVSGLISVGQTYLNATV